MGKKKHRKKYTSAGKHSTVRRSLVVATNRERPFIDIHLNKVEAWKRGLNPWITIPNPDLSATNRKHIRVRANEYFGDWRATFMIGAKEEAA